MNKREAIIEDHKEMLKIRKDSIKRYWSTRHKDRDLMRWQVTQAQFHKHMIVQVSELPDMKSFYEFEAT